MNVVCITGRAVKDPDIRRPEGSDFTIANFSLAVSREYKDKSGKYGVDYIDCTAFGKTAEFVEKYVKKGVKFEVKGNVRQERWKTKDGAWRSKMSVMVEQIRYAESAASSRAANAEPDETGVTINDGTVNEFMSVPDIGDDEVPFI